MKLKRQICRIYTALVSIFSALERALAIDICPSVCLPVCLSVCLPVKRVNYVVNNDTNFSIFRIVSTASDIRRGYRERVHYREALEASLICIDSTSDSHSTLSIWSK